MELRNEDSVFVFQLLELGRNGEPPRTALEDPEEVSFLGQVIYFHLAHNELFSPTWVMSPVGFL